MHNNTAQKLNQSSLQDLNLTAGHNDKTIDEKYLHAIHNGRDNKDNYLDLPLQQIQASKTSALELV